MDKILGETGHLGIRAARLQDSTVTNDPKVAIEEVLTSFKNASTMQRTESYPTIPNT